MLNESNLGVLCHCFIVSGSIRADILAVANALTPASICVAQDLRVPCFTTKMYSYSCGHVQCCSHDTAFSSHPRKRARLVPVARSRGDMMVELSSIASENIKIKSLTDIIIDYCSPSLKYSSDLWSCSEIHRLQASSKCWGSRSKEVAIDYTERVLSISQLSKDKVSVKWRARWIQKQLKWLVDFGRTWHMSVQYYDVLKRYGERTEFSWQALFKLLSSALKTGILRIPESAIEGELLLTVSEDGLVTSISESVWLVPLFQSFCVKNRRIARDMLVWQEIRQPVGTTYKDWDELFMSSLHIDHVPGMGQLYIDGLSESGRDDAYANSLVVMGFATVVLLSFGVAYGMVYMQQSTADQYLLDKYALLYDNLL
jgi:hypothetical protein